MKANEAPEKIWVHELSAMELNVPYKHYHIEYTRTDLFIEKACEWLRKYADDYTWYDETSGESGMIDGFVEVFRNHMKGE